MKKRILAILLVCMLVIAAMPMTAFAFNTLKIGSTGENVKTVQQILKNLGYSITVDGKYGENTAKCVKKYQEKNGLTADGKVGEKTWNSLMKHKDNYIPEKFPLKKGMKGSHVKKVQQVLRAHGFNVTADGCFGESTRKYVIAYQRMHDISADGVVGDTTWKSMNNTLSTVTCQVRLPLKSGDKCFEVKMIQIALKNHGLACGSDGKYDSTVVKAVKKYQKMHSLTADGKVGKVTWKSMISSIRIPAPDIPNAKVQMTKSIFPINSKSSVSNIKKVQNALKKAGYKVTVNGKYNNETKRAVTAYQKKKKIKQTNGYVDMTTWASLVATDQDKENVELLAKIIRRENGGASDAGQMAIALTVISYANLKNRSIEAELKSGRYSPCSSWSSFLKTKATAENIDNAKRVYYGKEKPFGSKKPLYFHGRTMKPAYGSWWTKLTMIGRLDGNVYYSN